MGKRKNEFVAVLPHRPGQGQGGSRGQQGLDGLGSVPGSFFCGTVVPASQPPTRNAILQYATSADNGSAGSFPKVPGF